MGRKSHITHGDELGPALLKMLGYDTDVHRVKAFAIYWRADGPPLVRITEYATVEQEQAVRAYIDSVAAAGEGESDRQEHVSDQRAAIARPLPVQARSRPKEKAEATDS